MIKRVFFFLSFFVIITNFCFIRADENTDQPPVSGMSIDFETGGEWFINSPNQRKIYAIQCGIDVTLFALKYFGVDYSLNRVSFALPLSEKETSLAHIHQLLLAYRLHVEARKCATVKQIAKCIDGSRIAILPLGMGNGQNHYYIAMMDNRGEIQLVNVSKGVSPLVSRVSKQYNTRHEEKFIDAGSVVLFISKNNKTSQLATHLVAVP